LRQEDRRFDSAEVAVAQELGSRAGRALENARLHAEVARLADREIGHAAELEAVLAAIGEGILVADPNGVIRSSNAAAVRLLGGRVITVSEVRDRLVSPDDGHPVSLEGESLEYQLVGHPDRWVEVTAYPIPGARDASLTSSVIVCRDVTAFRQGQALREAFLGLLSHELRTPVTTIYGGAAVLTRGATTLGLDARIELLQDIAAEADRLYRLVEDLMVLARFDEGLEIADEPTLLQHLIPVVVDQERSRWPTVTFDATAPPNLPVVRGDETAVEQVLRNLLSNAAKYSDGEGTVVVSVEPGDDEVVVRILDRGPGVDPDETAHLFDPFYRSPNTSSIAPGSGIGLYVSRRLIDAMGGRIWARPRDGGGSEFGFSLRRFPDVVDP
jgi:signal transduction histidine kinase